MLKKCPTDQLLDCFHTEADNDFPINEYYEVIRVMGNNKIFCICPGRNKSIPDTIGPLRSWVGDPLYQKCVEYVGHYVWDLAQKRRKNKFVFKMKSEGLDFTEGARYYHTYEISPRWSTSFPKVGRIGDHIFYRWES